jgi:predicted TIM-barrel fold metal-dependent hydrolase
MRPGCYDVDARVKDMDANGVLGSICFPSFVRFCGQLFLEHGEREQSAAMVRAYNDWHVEDWAGRYPERFIPLAIPILWDPELAAAEVRRMAAKGCHAVTFSSNPFALGLPSLYTDHWDPFLAACEEEGTVICMHLGSDSKVTVTAPEAPVEMIYSLSPIGLIEAATDLVWSPTFHKFPQLKVALSEGGVGWVPYFLERIDYIYSHTQHWTGTELGGKLPSEHFNEHVLLCFIDDKVGIETREHLNIDNIMWECDYPHSDSTWPSSPEVLARSLQGLSDEEINKITHLNAMAHFGFEPFSRLSRAEATAAALRRRAVGWDTSEQATRHLRPDHGQAQVRVNPLERLKTMAGKDA